MRILAMWATRVGMSRPPITRFENMATVSPWEYPEVRRDETVKEERAGTIISDPYRWLEDPDSEETKQFVEAQNNITMPYLGECPVKDFFNKR